MDIDRKHLRRLREFSGKSIRQLAREAEISHSHLAYVESGKRKPKEGVVKKLADALDVSMNDLING
jgi:transcriptional regulator with XRE-family HTH domain